MTEISNIPRVLEALSFVLEIERETIFMVKKCCMPGLLGYFIDDFILLVNELPRQHRIFIVGNFNLDQVLPKHVPKVYPLIQNFNVELIYMEKYWIWYLVIQIPILFFLFLYHTVITFVLFSKSDTFYLCRIYLF